VCTASSTTCAFFSAHFHGLYDASRGGRSLENDLDSLSQSFDQVDEVQVID
jgi:hypothetical protein